MNEWQQFGLKLMDEEACDEIWMRVEEEEDCEVRLGLGKNAQVLSLDVSWKSRSRWQLESARHLGHARAKELNSASNGQ